MIDYLIIKNKFNIIENRWKKKEYNCNNKYNRLKNEKIRFWKKQKIWKNQKLKVKIRNI